MKELKMIVTGVVQGVSYRDFVRAQAKKSGICGNVRNLPDGSVEVIAQGTEENLLELVSALKIGPVESRVENIETEWRDSEGKFSQFDIVF